MATLELTAEEYEMLRDILQNYLSDLRMEIVDTDAIGFKNMLKDRKQVIISLLGKLGVQAAPT